MRILLINHTPLHASGSGLQALMLAGALRAQGHEVATLAVRYRQDFTLPFNQHAVGTPRRPSRWNLPFDFPTTSGHRDSPRRYSELSTDELRTYRDVWTRAIADVCDEFAPDVVHVNHAFVLSDCVRAVGAAPYVVLSIGSELAHARNDRFRPAMERGARGAAGLIAVTADAARGLGELAGMSGTCIPVVGPGFDPTVFRPLRGGRPAVLRRLGLAGDRACVGFAGRLVPLKRAGDLFAAVAGSAAGERAEIVIIGDGPCRAMLEAEARADGLDVAFAGHLDDPGAIARLLGAIDLLTVPSEQDAYPMVVVEALACATPVLVSDGCGVVDVLPWIPGAVFPAGDVVALRDFIRRGIRESWKERLGPAGPALVAGMTWGARAERTAAVYRDALEAVAA